MQGTRLKSSKIKLIICEYCDTPKSISTSHISLEKNTLPLNQETIERLQNIMGRLQKHVNKCFNNW